MPTLTVQSHSPEQTAKIAQAIGAQLRGGETIELNSDVGGGKTTFVRGLVKGAGSTDHVSSPTFTISKTYKVPHCTIYHFDFYRLTEAGLMLHELDETVQDAKAVVVVEWSNIAEHVLPEDRCKVHIQVTGEDSREFVLDYPDSLSYLVKDL